MDRPLLLGRQDECRQLDQLLDAVRVGQSRPLVIRGEAGVGKSALLAHLVENAAGFRVLRVAGVQTEAEITFAGLRHLGAPLLDHLPLLPRPQRTALSEALGLKNGSAPDRFLVGLAVLSLLARAADEDPILCIVDDAHWIDRSSVQALAFVSRRLRAEPIALVFALRDDAGDQTLRGLPEIRVGGLPVESAHELLTTAMPGPLDPAVRDRLVAETRGNPLALLELPRGLSSSELAGGFGLLDARALSHQIEDSYRRRLVSLPREAQDLLLVAAAEATGDAGLVERAAVRLGVPLGTSKSTAFAGLVDWGMHLTFRHPLARSAVYRAAPAQQRRAVHRALAETIDRTRDADRRAWHLGRSADGPDEAIATELECSAERARTRGGLPAVAAFLARAAELTPDEARRGLRMLAAAEATLNMGAFDATITLLSQAEQLPLDGLQRARSELLRAELAFASNRGNHAAPLLVAAARRFEKLDPGLALDTYLDALAAAMFAGRLGGPTGVEQVAALVRATPSSRPSTKSDLLLEALVTRFLDGYAPAVDPSIRALQAFTGDIASEEGLRRYWLVAAMAADLWQDGAWLRAARQYVRLARDVGAVKDLALALNSCAVVEVFTGDLQTAAVLVDEATALTEATGEAHTPYGDLWLSAWQGREQDTRGLYEATLADASARGEGIGLSVAHAARAVLFNALGDHERAARDALEAIEFPHELAAPNWGLAELVEAAVGLGDVSLATRALARLASMTEASGTEWARGIEARSRALLTNDAMAEPLYLEAVDRLGRAQVRAELARAQLLYGEWLHEHRRHREARRHISIALDAFTAMGARAFARRCRRALTAAGEKARSRTVVSGGELTAQELRIARLACEGLSNPEIGAQLFLSPRTVEWHLGKIFGKLGIRSRQDLRHKAGRLG
jgi:DNA-binding CsgD family transcriptional regulator